MATLTKRKKNRPDIKAADILMQVFLLSFGLIITTPIIIGVLTSFKFSWEVSTYPPRFFPSQWTFENYVEVWEANPFGRFLLNSSIQAGIITSFQVLFSVLAAYAFAILEFPGSKLVFYLILGSLMVPFELTVIPNFLTINELGWFNTYAGLTVPFLASAFGVFMLRQFFLTVPRELYDAAVIDGVTRWGYLCQILVPLSKGSIGAFAIYSFLGAWNQYMWPLIATDDAKMRTVQVGIRYFMSDITEGGASWGAVMAGTVIVMLPTLAVFLFAQKQLVKGIAMTGLKG